jgi:hypothetical protein
MERGVCSPVGTTPHVVGSDLRARLEHGLVARQSRSTVRDPLACSGRGMLLVTAINLLRPTGLSGSQDLPGGVVGSAQVLRLVRNAHCAPRHFKRPRSSTAGTGPVMARVGARAQHASNEVRATAPSQLRGGFASSDHDGVPTGANGGAYLRSMYMKS